MTLSRYRSQWLSNPGRELLAGMVGTFALIPEVIAFSYVAGVQPQVGLFASFVISIAIALTGGCPGMISGAAGSVALVAASLVHAHGLQYLLAATLLAGSMQVAFGLAGLHQLMRFVSRSVRTGFVNALAIMIFAAQLPQIFDADWHGIALIALGLAIIYLMPRVTTIIPSPLICIVVIATISALWPMKLRVIADLGALPTGLPDLVWPHVPASFETLRIIAPYALAMALVGILESLMTARVVDDLTDTHSDKRMESTGLGLANIAAGLFGGIAGCGMIGQTVGNLRYGGKGRLSTAAAGGFLLLFMIMLHPVIARIPVAALVAIMIMVSASTFSWSSLRDLFSHPKSSSIVMLTTVAVVIATHDLAAGVAAGVLLSGMFFASRMTAMLEVRSSLNEQACERTYVVTGHVFFASSEQFTEYFDFHETLRGVVLDVAGARFWDITAVSALDQVLAGFRARGIAVRLDGVDLDDLHSMVARHGRDELLVRQA